MRPSPLHFHPFSAESVHLIVYRAAALADLSFTNCAIEYNYNYNYNEADVILQEPFSRLVGTVSLVLLAKREEPGRYS
jgi:hypothetical protein